MDKTIIEKKLPGIVKKIAEQFKPGKIILFGSYAWGSPGPDSDVDLFIVKNTDKKRIERGQEIERILWGSGIPIDALVYTPEEVEEKNRSGDIFFQHILKNGKVLYSSMS